MESAEPSLRRSRQWRRRVGRKSWITESTRNFDSDLPHQSNDLVFVGEKRFPTQSFLLLGNDEKE